MIPEFQRDYVWKPRQAPQLIDSLYHGYPISSLLIWSSNDSVQVRRRDPRPARGDEVSWLIDGQQRVITLSRVMTGDEGIDVVFDAEAQQFARSSATTKYDPKWVRVTELWDDEAYRRIRKNLEDNQAGRRTEERYEKVRKILDYEIPQVIMINHGFNDAVQAFTRINTLGVRLKKEDIQSAQVAAKHSGFIHNDVIPFLDKLHKSGFNRIYIMHLFRICAFIANQDGRQKTPLHELTQEEVKSAWKVTVRAVNDAISIMHSELGILNMQILWSASLLVPCIALCAIHSPRERPIQGILGWMGLAALLHRYSGSSETALDQDLKACRSTDPINALLKNLRQDRDSLLASSHDFSGSLADKSGLFAVYIACKKMGALDLLTEGKIILQPNVERHHIIPKALFEAADRASADTLANIALISGDSNRSITDSRPEAYLTKISKSVLTAQCIPLDKNLYSVENAEDFWEARRELLAAGFNEFLKAALPKRRL